MFYTAFIIFYFNNFQECQKNKTQLDFEPKTSHDFVENLELLDNMEHTIKDLK